MPPMTKQLNKDSDLKNTFTKAHKSGSLHHLFYCHVQYVKATLAFTHQQHPQISLRVLMGHNKQKYWIECYWDLPSCPSNHNIFTLLIQQTYGWLVSDLGYDPEQCVGLGGGQLSPGLSRLCVCVCVCVCVWRGGGGAGGFMLHTKGGFIVRC